MDKVYIVETTHESGEKERREVEATHIIEAFQKGPYDPYATMVIVKEKVSRDYKAEIAYLTAENERLRGEVEEQKSIAEHEHATQMEWFSIAGDYKAENAELRERLNKVVELPYERKRLLWGDKDKETLLCPDCLTDIMGGIGDETFVVQCPNCGCFVNSAIEPIEFTANTEARLKEIKERK